MKKKILNVLLIGVFILNTGFLVKSDESDYPTTAPVIHSQE